ncbi:MAG: dihydroneopterin aldolase [Lysobacterales bacterium]
MTGGDSLLIENLTADARIGVHSFEQKTPQKIALDLKLFLDLSASAKSDQLSDALDYVTVSQALKSHIQQSRFGLIEALAESCTQLLLNQFPIAQVRLSLRKPGALPGDPVVGVTITRCRDDR